MAATRVAGRRKPRERLQPGLREGPRRPPVLEFDQGKRESTTGEKPTAGLQEAPLARSPG